MHNCLLRYLLLGMFLTAASTSNAQYVDTSLLVPNSSISGFAENDSLLFMYGAFTSFAQKDPYGVIIDTITGSTFPNTNPDDQVNIAVPDGHGGWFVGGDFLNYGGLQRSHLAQIDSAGIITPFAVNVNGPVGTLFMSGDTLYIGGSFTSVNNQTRNHAASVVISTAMLTGWDPDITGTAWTFAVKHDSVYIGGSFTAVGGIARDNICVVDNDTGGVGPWSPDLNGPVICLLAAGTRLYIGGSFTTINMFTLRGRGAAYNMTTYTLLSWNPDADGHIEDMVSYNGRLFICGSFNNLASNPHESFAEVDINTGTVVSPVQADGIIAAHEMVIANDQAYIVGVINIVNNVARHDAVALNINTGAVEPWMPEPGWDVGTIALSGDKFYIGGIFQGIHAQIRINIAAINKQTGQLHPWNANGDQVNCMLVIDSILYVGGDFTSIDGIFRNRLAAFNLNTFTVTSWNPNADDAVNAMIYSDSLIYVAGDFTAVGGEGRSKVAAIKFGTDSVTDWDPPVIIGTPRINSIAKIDSILYVAGTFQFVGGHPRNRLAAYHVGRNDSLTPWSPNANNQASTIRALGNRLIVEGNFTAMNSVPVQKIAVLDTTFGNFSPGFTTQFDNSVGLFHVNGPRILVTGSFMNYGPTPTQHFAMISSYNGSLLPYHLNVDATPSVYESDGWIYLSSNVMRTINQVPVWNFARVSSSQYLEVSGNVWMDTNADGIRDTNELPASYYPVSVSSNNYTAYTDLNGNYVAYVDSGQFVAAPLTVQSVIASTPASRTVNVSQANPHDSLNDFGLIQTPGIEDMSVYLTPVGIARANGPRYYHVTAINNGSTTGNPLIKISDDAVQTYAYSNPVEDSVNIDSAFYSITTFHPTQHFSLDVVYTLPICPVGTPLWLAAEINPVLTDTIPVDNYDTLNTLVIAAYDPNYKEVFPSELYVPLTTTQLEYVVHFQNTGNDTAINIRLVDTLSAFLDAQTLQFISASHISWYHLQGQVLTVDFDSIMLPDSTTSALLSQGYFHYTVNTGPTVVQNTVVNNTAYIYFDYNAPIVTNTTTTIFLLSVITETEDDSVSPELTIYPVPANNNITLVVPLGLSFPATVDVRNLLGETVSSFTITNTVSEINLDGFDKGIYFLSVSDTATGELFTKEILVMPEK